MFYCSLLVNSFERPRLFAEACALNALNVFGTAVQIHVCGYLVLCGSKCPGVVQLCCKLICHSSCLENVSTLLFYRPTDDNSLHIKDGFGLGLLNYRGL